MKTQLTLLSALLLLGCAEVVEPWHPASEPQEVTKRIHCTYVGYCLDVATIGFDGTFRLGPSIGLRYNCSGSQNARVVEQVFEQTWSNGHVDRVTRTKVLEKLSECE